VTGGVGGDKTTMLEAAAIAARSNAHSEQIKKASAGGAKDTLGPAQKAMLADEIVDACCCSRLRRPENALSEVSLQRRVRCALAPGTADGRNEID